MRISEDWLADFLSVPPVEVLSPLLASVGIEVEDVLDPSACSEGVIVGVVQACAAHPQADRLSLCRVFDGASEHQVVCGAANVREGLKVAFAPLGARVTLGRIEPRKIRGVESSGMLCSEAELGLAEESSGICELPADAAVGLPIERVLNMSAVLGLGITPNRPDLMSHVGVAREVAAATGQRMTPSKWRLVEKGPACSTLARIVVEAPVECRRYAARVVQGLKVGPSPAWLKQRLERIGQRSINNVVDVTNYVLLELGQPLHAFDISRLTVESGQPTLYVRRAKDGERCTTLDGETRELTADDLVIADAHRPVALAGVMGGADSEVSDSTTSVLLEGAYFDPAVVRRMARRHGLHTEASKRFERGADIGLVQKALDRCAQLLAEVAGGVVAKGTVEVFQKGEAPREVPLRLERIPRLLGISLSAEAVVQLLEPLEIRCIARNESSLRFVAPTFRPDLTREADLLEEVARRYGYDNIPETLPAGSAGWLDRPPLRPRRDVLVRDAMLAQGCTECVTYGFGSPRAFAWFGASESSLTRVLNPLGEELSALRTTLMAGLLTVLRHNQRHGAEVARLFEVGTVFNSADDDGRPQEVLKVAGLFWGRRAEGWCSGKEQIDAFDMVGSLETLQDVFGAGPGVRREPLEGGAEGFNTHSVVRLSLDEDVVGLAGQLHPDVLRAWDVKGPVFAYELSVDALAAQVGAPLRYEPLPRFPGTRRDIAVIAPRDLPAEHLRAFLNLHAGGEMGAQVIEDVRLFDVYEGKNIPDGHVSLAFSIDYRHRERTLTDEEVGSAFEAVLGQLREHFGVDVRGS